ncbi:hypothetical protein CCACVL1_17763 [Corchorus capsularis]|uniref:Uncharacterized protein n=1 Tax=Corchorus capsularis TaxID=210143 RepID=A0A1R3HQJ0_COCAP|nr:hypothetical protein CCACVL1_17763 [Corchorus capsularis]
MKRIADRGISIDLSDDEGWPTKSTRKPGASASRHG